MLERRGITAELRIQELTADVAIKGRQIGSSRATVLPFEAAFKESQHQKPVLQAL